MNVLIAHFLERASRGRHCHSNYRFIEPRTRLLCASAEDDRPPHKSTEVHLATRLPRGYASECSVTAINMSTTHDEQRSLDTCRTVDRQPQFTFLCRPGKSTMQPYSHRIMYLHICFTPDERGCTRHNAAVQYKAHSHFSTSKLRSFLESLFTSVFYNLAKESITRDRS